ncbi:MAG: hypothetical protein AAGF85_04990 [Bacteroidota bacterium]
MPARSKYLSSGWTRLSKILAMFFGAYAATATLHVALAKNVTNDVPVLLTSTYTSFLCWVGLMVMVFMIRKAWISWVILLGLIGLSSLLIFMV